MTIKRLHRKEDIVVATAVILLHLHLNHRLRSDHHEIAEIGMFVADHATLHPILIIEATDTKKVIVIVAREAVVRVGKVAEGTTRTRIRTEKEGCRLGEEVVQGQASHRPIAVAGVEACHRRHLMRDNGSDANHLEMIMVGT